MPPDERARHWTVEAAMGAAAAVSAIAIAQALLPDRAQALAQQAPARQVARAPIAPPEPAYLVAFNDPVVGREIISPFGLRQLPWEENGRLHEGVDIAAPFGSAVLAAADGVVVDAGRSDTYGRFVRLKHAAGLTTLYAHMGAVADGLASGQAVKAGAPVGKIGSSGTSTGPHLHFELRDEKDRPLNPGLFLGQTFHAADDLPLRAARRVPRGVRIAWVSRIPASKRELMQAKLVAKTAARDAASAGKDASVTVMYGDGRPRARFTFAPSKAPPPVPAEDAPIATAEAPPV